MPSKGAIIRADDSREVFTSHVRISGNFHDVQYAISRPEMHAVVNCVQTLVREHGASMLKLARELMNAFPHMRRMNVSSPSLRFVIAPVYTLEQCTIAIMRSTIPGFDYMIDIRF